MMQTVPLEVFQREREKRIQAEKDRDYYKREFFLIRDLRRAPVLKPVAKEILQEFRHVEKWGTVKDAEGKTRANFRTIADHLKISPDTVTTQAERMEKLGLIEIHEFQGPKDACDRKYVHVLEEKLKTLDALKDTEKVIPQQGGNRYICTKCESPDVDVRTETRITIRCNGCQHEEVVENTIGNTNWKPQLVHKRQKMQKQHAFEHETSIDEETGEVIEIAKSVHTEEDEKQLAEHSVYTQSIDATACAETSQKQLAFTDPPEFLRNQRIWCCGRLVWNEERQKFDKIPYMADMAGTRKASSTDTSTWRTYEYTLAIFEKSQSWTQKNSPPFDVLMFMCNGTFTFLDQDHCRDQETGEFETVAIERARAINSYTEESVSGDGIHTYAIAKLPPGRRRNDNLGIEMYDSGRPCVYTGKLVPSFPLTVERRQEEVAALHAEIFPPQPEMLWSLPDNDDTDRSDEEMHALLKETLQKISRAKNGERILKLWDGDYSDYPDKNGRPDHSRGDVALCNMLAFYVGKSVSTVDWLFRHSKMYRPKWERSDYRERTFRYAFGLREDAA